MGLRSRLLLRNGARYDITLRIIVPIGEGGGVLLFSKAQRAGAAEGWLVSILPISTYPNL